MACVPDPALVLIAAEAKAWDAFIAAPDQTSNAAGSVATETLFAALQCPPTTPEGAAALIRLCRLRLADWLDVPGIDELLTSLLVFLSSSPEVPSDPL